MSLVANLLQSLGPAGGGGPGPTTPTLTVADNGDDTGATATIAGGDSDSTNVVYTIAVDNDFDSALPVSSGTRVGNGTVALSSLSAGLYWAYNIATSPDGGEVVTHPVYFRVTTGIDAVHWRCITDIQAKMVLLGLSSIVSGSIILRKLPIEEGIGEEGGVPLPCVILSPTKEQIKHSSGTNKQDDIGYGVQVVVLSSTGEEREIALENGTYMKWREDISRAFRHQKLPNVAESWDCYVEPLDSIIPHAWFKGLVATAFVLRIFCRETRGT